MVVTIKVWAMNQITKDQKIGTAKADVNAAKNNGGGFWHWLARTYNVRAPGRIQVQLIYVGTDLQPTIMIAHKALVQLMYLVQGSHV